MRTVPLAALLLLACAETAPPLFEDAAPPDPDLDVIDAAIDVAVDAVVDAEPDARLAMIGDPCDSPADCPSPYCIEASGEGRRICTGPCDPSDPDFCPDGMVCAAVTNAGPDRSFLCFPEADFLCRACEGDDDCGGLSDACLDYDDGRFCGRACELRACPEGFDCEDGQCRAPAGVCSGCLDPDGDGYGMGDACLGPDCAPDDGMVHPGVAEVCDEADDDCDGMVDEGFDLSSDVDHCGGCGIRCRFEGAEALCEDGECVLGACLPGRNDVDRRAENGCEYICGDGTPGADEVCDGRDDDCDGQVDEGLDVDAACGTGEFGRCSRGIERCAAGRTVCERAEDPLPESCDGTDEDCDGRVDEGDPGGGVDCVTMQPGRCAPGIRACVAGALRCSPREQARGETCDDTDDDCDGSTDERCPSDVVTAGDRNLAAFGGGGGGDFRIVCPAGQLAVGVDVRAGAEVDQIQVICQAVGLAVDRAGAPFGYATAGVGGQSRTAIAGGGGGGQQTLVCPGGSFLHALRVRSGARVDQATFTCARMAFRGYPDAPSTRRTDTQSATFGGNGGGANAEQRCNDGELMSGLYGRSGARLDRLGPVCRRFSVPTR